MRSVLERNYCSYLSRITSLYSAASVMGEWYSLVMCNQHCLSFMHRITTINYYNDQQPVVLFLFQCTHGSPNKYVSNCNKLHLRVWWYSAACKTVHGYNAFINIKATTFSFGYKHCIFTYQGHNIFIQVWTRKITFTFIKIHVHRNPVAIMLILASLLTTVDENILLI